MVLPRDAVDTPMGSAVRDITVMWELKLMTLSAAHQVSLFFYFFTQEKPAVPVTSSESASYAILHLGAVYLGWSHEPIGKGGVG